MSVVLLEGVGAQFAPARYGVDRGSNARFRVQKGAQKGVGDGPARLWRLIQYNQDGYINCRVESDNLVTASEGNVSRTKGNLRHWLRAQLLLRGNFAWERTSRRGEGERKGRQLLCNEKS